MEQAFQKRGVRRRMWHVLQKETGKHTVRPFKARPVRPQGSRKLLQVSEEGGVERNVCFRLQWPGRSSLELVEEIDYSSCCRVPKPQATWKELGSA